MKEFEIIPNHCKSGNVYFNEQNAIVNICRLLKEGFDVSIRNEEYIKISTMLKTAINENKETIKFNVLDFEPNNPDNGFIQCNISEVDDKTLYVVTEVSNTFRPIEVNDYSTAISIIVNCIRAWSIQCRYDISIDVPWDSINTHLTSCFETAIAKERSYVLFPICGEFMICCEIIKYWDKVLKTKYLITAYDDENMDRCDSIEETVDYLHRFYKLDSEKTETMLNTNENIVNLHYSFLSYRVQEGNIRVFVINNKIGDYYNISFLEK